MCWRTAVCVTYVETRNLVVTAIGPSLTAVLLFGRPVLSAKWWKKYVFRTASNAKRQNLEDVNMVFFVSNHDIGHTKSQSLIQIQKEKSSKLNYVDFKGKNVFTCEMAEVGYVTNVENQLMNIVGNRSNKNQLEEYIIPTYYVRECNKKGIFIDTSMRYLDHYQVRENTKN
jgi:hypothetical protein